MGVVETLVASPILSFLSGIAVATIPGILVVIYRRRQEKKDDIKKWYQDAVGLVARVQQTGYRTTMYQHQVNYPKLHEKLEPLAEDIQEHAAGAPNGVDDDARLELAYLSAFCSGVLTLTEQAEELTPADFFRTIQRHARETYTGEHDMEDVNDLIGAFDVDALVDVLPNDVEVNEEALDEFRSHFSDNSLEAGQPTTIDEALEMPLDGIEDVFVDERVMQELLGDAFKDYVRLILTDHTQDIHGNMEARKRRME